VMFSERAGGIPDAIKEWFYPGDNFGQMFVYPKGQELQTAQATQPPVVDSTPQPQEAPAQAEGAPAPAPAEPAPPAQEAAPQASEPEQQPAPPAAATPAPEEPAPAAPESLPKTGSELPLIGLLGLGSLGTGFLSRILRRG
jgi:LPXTG-motif cell wall-anchored protein